MQRDYRNEIIRRRIENCVMVFYGIVIVVVIAVLAWPR